MFNVDYYIKNPVEIFNLRNGGLAIYGGIIGGFITCYVFCKKKKINLLDLIDYIVPALAIRAINWKMGQFYKSRSLWKQNKSSLENGNCRSRRIHRSSSNFFIRIYINIFNIHIIT
jgi:prolipoprotein diacylglyceryltransferase